MAQYIWAVVIGITMGGGFVTGLTSDHKKMYFKAAGLIEECEASLPRNQSCVITANITPEQRNK